MKTIEFRTDKWTLIALGVVIASIWFLQPITVTLTFR